MSKQKPTPPPSAPPLTGRTTNPEGSAMAARVDAAAAQVEAGTITTPEAYLKALEPPAVGQPLSAEAAQEAMLTALHRRLGAVALDGETSLQALERVIEEAAGYRRGLSNDSSTDDGNTGLSHFYLSDLTRQLWPQGQEGEKPPAILARVIRERDDALAQAQATHNVLGPHANARGILMTHVAESGPDYDTGGRYRVATITVSRGVVDIREIYDLGPNGEPSPVMQYGTAVDHVEKRVDDFLRPKAHRA